VATKDIKTIEIPVDLYDRLMDFLDRWHTSTCDPKFVGKTIKAGESVMAELICLGEEQGFVAIHQIAQG
jgi:hypothetical protein